MPLKRNHLLERGQSLKAGEGEGGGDGGAMAKAYLSSGAQIYDK